MAEKKLTGKIARERIRMMETPQKSVAEEAKCRAIDSGVPVADLPA